MKLLPEYLSLLCFTLLFCFSLRAEQLAVKNFSITEGLSRNQISAITEDSRGYIWIGTADGINRFDGYNFTSYNIGHGLPNPFISGIIEHEKGVFWVATHGGLCLIDFNRPLDNTGQLSIKLILLGDSINTTIFSIYRDSQKTLWAGTRNGLYKIYLSNQEFRSELVSLGKDFLPRRAGIGNFAEDQQGNFWISTPDGLFRIDSAGEINRYELGSGQYFDRLGNMAVDQSNRLWIGGLSGLYVLSPPSGKEKITRLEQSDNQLRLPQNPGEFAVYDEKSGLADKRALEIFRSSDNQMWIATRHGLTVFDGESFRRLGSGNGLTSDELLCFGEDSAGNLWIGTETTGVMRVASNGFTSYSTADGLPDNRISSVFEGSGGEIYAVDESRNISRFEDGRFIAVTPNFPKTFAASGWSWQQPVLQNSIGEWWIGASGGLVHFPKVNRLETLSKIPPRSVYDSESGLAGNHVFRLYEARNGDLWISSFSPPSSGIARLNRATGELKKFKTNSLVNSEPVSAYSYSEDNEGNLWLGLTNGTLAIFRNEELRIIENIPGLPATNIYDIFRDRRGSLWLATGAGAFYLKNPAAENPRVSALTVQQGLSTNDIIAVTEDLKGRIYFATSQGVQRYHPETKRIELFTTADGLASSELRTAMRSRNGELWFGTIRGLTRFNPDKLREAEHPSPVYIRSVRSGGAYYPLSELGSESVAAIEISPEQNQLEIEVFGLTQHSGDNLKYQYKIQSGDDWSEPSAQRRFTLVNLQPGNYRFEARAINSSGLISRNSATVSFIALAPFYRQWWFMPLTGLIVCIIIYLFYRSRLKRLIELESVRRHIAGDLHDDIGSSLSQISLISQVLALKEGTKRDDKQHLDTIAETAREAIEAMSEMIWTINPKNDNLTDTIQRMRRFTSEILAAKNIKFTFQADGFSEKNKIDVNVRRQFYLIYKEAINNIAKHSKAAMVSINISRSANSIIVVITDNGRGFTESDVQKGNGLANMRLRATRIGSALEIDSQVNKGTTVRFRVPRANRLSILK